MAATATPTRKQLKATGRAITHRQQKFGIARHSAQQEGCDRPQPVNPASPIRLAPRKAIDRLDRVTVPPICAATIIRAAIEAIPARALAVALAVGRLGLAVVLAVPDGAREF
jgi:hypothetical protein